VCEYFTRRQSRDIKCKHARVVILSILHSRGVTKSLMSFDSRLKVDYLMFCSVVRMELILRRRAAVI